MSEALERAKGRTLKEITHVLRWAYRWGGQPTGVVNSYGYSWRKDRITQDYAKGDPDKQEECEALFSWGVQNPHELEVYLAGRSPGTVSNWAVSYNRRLCDEAERIVKDKAKDRSTLLDYCSHFGVLLDDVSKITMKAAFEDNSRREKAYIKKMEHTKKRLKEFLGQMVKTGQLDSALTVGELIETL